jgi:hypothetical protein
VTVDLTSPTMLPEPKALEPAADHGEWAKARVVA